MPVIIKIIWVILLVNVFFAIFKVTGAFDAGYDLFGMHLTRMMAVNVAFALQMVLPVMLIIAMYQRYRGTVLYAIIYFLFFIVNAVFMLGSIDAKTEFTLAQTLEQMPELAEGLDEASLYAAAYLAVVITIIMDAAFNLTLLILFLVKRNYFIEPENSTPADKPELPS